MAKRALSDFFERVPEVKSIKAIDIKDVDEAKGYPTEAKYTSKRFNDTQLENDSASYDFLTGCAPPKSKRRSEYRLRGKKKQLESDVDDCSQILIDDSDGAQEQNRVTSPIVLNDSLIEEQPRVQELVPVKLAPIFLKPLTQSIANVDPATCRGQGPQKKSKSKKAASVLLTAKKLAGLKNSNSQKEVLQLLSEATDRVITYSPKSRNKKSKALSRLSSPQRSRSPSPDSAKSSPKKSHSSPSKLIASYSSSQPVPHDCAPCCQVVHVRQYTTDERRWLEALASCGQEEMRGVASQRPSLGAPRLELKSSKVIQSAQSPVATFEKAMNQLRTLQENHRDVPVFDIFWKCVRATRGCYEEREPFEETDNCQSLMCSIKVRVSNGRKRRIIVEQRALKSSEDTSRNIINLCSPTDNGSRSTKWMSEPLVDHWSALLAPCCSREVLGNSYANMGISQWLKEWAGQPSGQAKASSSEHTNLVDLNKSDSDFESPVKVYRRARKRNRIDDDEEDWAYEDGDEEQCKALFLTGPVGSGKKSSIYATANELGYKVMEVTSSSQRGRREVLSSFMEATQSHQVMLSSSNSVEQPNPTKGIASFFKPSKKCAVKSKEGDTRRCQSQNSQANDVSLAKLGLILVEDVDVVFDDHDKGFWAAMNEIVELSKKPIVMTACNSNWDVDDCIRVSFSHPTKELPVYLQILSLSHGYIMEDREAGVMAALFNYDIRRCIMILQFYLTSKGGPVNPTTCSVSAATGEEEGEGSLWLLSHLLGCEVNLKCSTVSTTSHAALKDAGVSVTDVVCENAIAALAREGESDAAKVKQKMETLTWMSDSLSSLDILGRQNRKVRFNPYHSECWRRAAESNTLLDLHREDTSLTEFAVDVQTAGESLLCSLLQATTDSCCTDSNDIKVISKTVELVTDADRRLKATQDQWSSIQCLFSSLSYLSTASVPLELMPFVRQICKTEQIRKKAKTKRRFRHYLTQECLLEKLNYDIFL